MDVSDASPITLSVRVRKSKAYAGHGCCAVDGTMLHASTRNYVEVGAPVRVMCHPPNDVRAVYLATAGLAETEAESGAVDDKAPAQRPPRIKGCAKGERRKWALERATLKANGSLVATSRAAMEPRVLSFTVSPANAYAVEQNTKGMVLLEMSRFLGVEPLHVFESADDAQRAAAVGDGVGAQREGRQEPRDGDNVQTHGLLLLQTAGEKEAKEAKEANGVDETNAAKQGREEDRDHHQEEEEVDDASLGTSHARAAGSREDKARRNAVFAAWLVSTYGRGALSKGTGVLDVAGGKGELCAALNALGVPCVLLEPDARGLATSLGVAGGAGGGGSAPATTQVVVASLEGDGSSLLARGNATHASDEEKRASALVRGASIVVGMHADAATEPIVDLALALGVPFAVIPCCVLPALFPFRTIAVVGKKTTTRQKVRSYRAFCQYLLDKASDRGLAPFQTDHLAFVGKNQVIFYAPAPAPASTAVDYESCCRAVDDEPEG